MLDTTSEAEPSDLVKASPLLMKYWNAGLYPLEELERRALGAIRLREAFSCVPFYAQRAESNPDYWNEFYASRPNW